MNPFQADYERLIEILDNAKSEVLSVNNPDISMVTTRITSQLTNQVNFLKAYSGTASSIQKTRIIGTPLKGMFGKKLNLPDPERRERKAVIADKKSDSNASARTQDAESEQLEQLKKDRDDLYDKFLELETADIVDQKDDMVIRAVAKKVGLPVTESNPKRITVKFVNQIKEAIQKFKDLESAKIDNEEEEEEQQQ